MAAVSALRLDQGKPPSVLILCDSVSTSCVQTDDRETYFQLVRKDLTTCIGHDRYVIYPLLLEDVERSPWQENCQLLIAPACLDLADSPPNVVQSLVRYVEEGGRCLAMNKRIVEELLGCSSAEKTPTTSPLHHVTPCIPSLELEGFVVPLLFEFARTDNKLECKPLAKFLVVDSAVSCVQLVVGSTCQQMHCVISSVDLLAPSVEGLTVSMVTELKQSAQARHSFLGAVLQQLGVEYVPSSIPSLSYTYLFTRTDEVSNTLFSVSASSAKLHLQQRLNFLSQDSSLTTTTWDSIEAD